MWTIESLKEGLNKDLFEVEITSANAAVVKVKEQDLAISLAIVGEVITTSAIVCDSSDVLEENTLNARILALAPQYLSLGAAGIAALEEGKTAYYVYGKASATSTKENVELELTKIASDAMILAELIENHNESVNS